MSHGNAGRAYATQQTHYLRRTFLVGTAGFAAAATGWIGTLPKGAVVRGTLVKVNAVFASVTSDVVDVGTAADPDALVAAANLQLAGGQYSITGMDFASPTEGTPIYAQWTAVGTVSVVGSVTVIVEYFPDNDQ